MINQLVEEIKKVVQDETILNAFRMVPRHKFVTTFLNKISTGDKKQEWSPIHPSDKGWLEEVYKNRPLTTSINKHGDPNVSSSQPDIMAKMIQSVQLKSGQRVLEIGTGTGYNAAILAAIVGPENVVSIDINQTLLNTAKERIEHTIGLGATLLHADGRNLPEMLGMFNAIIVTGSHDRIEPSWIKALAPSGRIIFNWIKSLTKVMIAAEKGPEKMIGQICQYRGDFMHLHDGNGVEWRLLPPQPLELIEHIASPFPLLSNSNFGFFLQINLPEIECHHYRKKSGERYCALKEGDRVVQFFQHEVKGDPSLYQEIHAINEQFERLGKPKPQVFSLIIDPSGSMTFTYKDNLTAICLN